jgi:DNA-binding transcriptional MerR regulator
MSTVRSFHRYRGETSFTMQRFLAILKEQLPKVAPSQTKYRVTQMPTDRTIRFYTANGLVDKPAAREGTHALYGYRHLLQVLAVKYLQSHYFPLVKIRSLVQNVGNRDLEMLIPEFASVTATHRAYTREDRKVVERSFRSPGTMPSSSATGLTALDVEPDHSPEPLDAWHRLEIGPGIELNIHASALSPQNRERLRRVLLRELGVLRGWHGGEDKR